ncbi:MAG: HlyD family type I secretion periplasmic adaptor subunit [Alphaproteobacteria bacterium]|nr:HlyD family type I secretion periplasmic adaptor subunit [Alphaproteobacteria bacterium]
MSESFDRLANGFKSDATAIEEAPVPVSAHAALYLFLTLLVLAVLWSVIGQVDRIVVAQGKIATRDPMLVMQPFTTSRIVSINVQAGDHVAKGQVLARFDPVFAEADVASLEQKVASLRAETDRIEAQLAGRVFNLHPGDSPERATQAQIYTQEMSNYESETNQRTSQLGQIESQLRANRDVLPGIRSQVGVANQVMAMQDRLRQQQAAATLDVLRAQSSLIDSNNRLRNTQGEIQRLSNQRSEVEHERAAFIEKWRADHNQRLVEARQQLAEATETLNKAHRMREFTEITAPVDGTVQEVADRSIGSVLKEAETLVTLVPDKAPLFVEAMVASRDVSYLKLDDPVRVKLESYPFQRFGTVSGVLTEISPDSISQKEGEGDRARLVYRVQVKLTDRPADLVKRGFHLKPGLVASAEIKTGRRTIASYILDPVLKIADESLREP